MALGGSACGGTSLSPATDGPDCSVPSEARRIPPDLAALELGRWGTVTKAEARAGFLGAEVVSEQEVVEIYPDLVRRLSGPYTFLGGENEGFEAELSFTDRKGRVLSFTLTEIACDRVLFRVLVEKSAA